MEGKCQDAMENLGPFRYITPMMESQMDKSLENSLDAGILYEVI